MIGADKTFKKKQSKFTIYKIHSTRATGIYFYDLTFKYKNIFQFSHLISKPSLNETYTSHAKHNDTKTTFDWEVTGDSSDLNCMKQELYLTRSTRVSSTIHARERSARWPHLFSTKRYFYRPCVSRNVSVQMVLSPPLNTLRSSLLLMLCFVNRSTRYVIFNDFW